MLMPHADLLDQQQAVKYEGGYLLCYIPESHSRQDTTVNKPSEPRSSKSESHSSRDTGSWDLFSHSPLPHSILSLISPHACLPSIPTLRVFLDVHRCFPDKMPWETSEYSRNTEDCACSEEKIALLAPAALFIPITKNQDSGKMQLSK